MLSSYISLLQLPALGHPLPIEGRGFISCFYVKHIFRTLVLFPVNRLLLHPQDFASPLAFVYAGWNSLIVLLISYPRRVDYYIPQALKYSIL